MVQARTARTTSSLPLPTLPEQNGTLLIYESLTSLGPALKPTKGRDHSETERRFKAGVNFAGVKEVPNFLNHLVERSAFAVMQGHICIRAYLSVVSPRHRFASLCRILHSSLEKCLDDYYYSAWRTELFF